MTGREEKVRGGVEGVDDGVGLGEREEKVAGGGEGKQKEDDVEEFDEEQRWHRQAEAPSNALRDESKGALALASAASAALAAVEASLRSIEVSVSRMRRRATERASERQLCL